MDVQAALVAEGESFRCWKVFWIQVQGVDSWEGVRKVPLLQDPVALGASAAILIEDNSYVVIKREMNTFIP